MELSQRQDDIVVAWDETDSNLLIQAVAGSGKTFTLFEILKRCNHRTLFLAFNKSIQQEIQGKMDRMGLSQGKALTLHSLGLSAIKSSRRRYKVNNNKNWDIIKKIQTSHAQVFRKIPQKNRMAVIYSLMDMNDISRMFLCEDFEELKVLMNAMGKVVPAVDKYQDLWEAFLHERNLSYESNVMEIDFHDMIYVPVIKNLYIPIEPYYLMMDECQDFNLCQHTFIDKLIQQGTIQRWVAVGDPNQAIYGFAGALSNSFDLFLQKGDNILQLPLDLCYRCAKNIIEYSNEVYDVMTAARDFDGIVEDMDEVDEIKPNSMVICRNSTPLIKLYFSLLGKGKNCFINGKEIMNYLINFLKPFNNHTIHTAKIEMDYIYTDLKADESDNGKIKSYIFEENYGNFLEISRNMFEPTDKIEMVIERLQQLFQEKENAIMLCTIHKSKGLENDVVYILNENLIPSKFAINKEQLKQETNLKYVARTRARDEMYFLNLN